MDGRLFPRRLFILSLTGLALCTAPTWADDETSVWTLSGQPSGGQVFKVVVNPTGTLFAVANPGVFESNDDGASWSLAFAMPDGVDVAVDPVKPANLYAAGNDSGLWKSTDGGTTWNELSGVPKTHLVVVDPVNEGVVYTIANGCDVYKSVNGGTSWKLIDTGISGLTGNANANCTQIAVDATNPQILYLATQVGAFDSDTGARDGSSLSGLYSSVDGGAHWTQNLPKLGFADVVIDPSNDQNVYAGNYASHDGGATWAAATGTDTYLTVIAVDPANSQVLWGVEKATVLANLWTSSDQGAHWSQVSMPQANEVYNLAYDPSTPATVYASSLGFGVYKSTDGGSKWAESTDGITGVFSFDIVMDSTGTIYMGTEGTGVFKSTDQGSTWVMKDAGIPALPGGAGITAESMVESSTPGTLYETDQNYLYKTTNGGNSWSNIYSRGAGSINTLAVDPEQADTIYLGTGGGQVQKSVDGGAHWTQSSSGLPADGIAALAVDPTNSNVVYAGGFDSGLYKSADGGSTWSSADASMPTTYGVDCVAVDPKTPQNVYACPGNAGIYKSTDGGKTWAQAGSGLPNDAFRILQIDPNDPDVIYAVIPNLVVYVSTDAGTTWTKLGNPSASTEAMRRRDAFVPAGYSSRTSSSASQSVTISSIAVDPRHADHVYGVSSDGTVYAAQVNGSSTSSSGGQTSSGTSAAASSSGGGGDVSLLASALLLGFALRRRAV